MQELPAEHEDFQDAHALTTESPVLEFRKTVVNVTTGQNPGSNARPGDVMQYTVTVRNVSTLPVSAATQGALMPSSRPRGMSFLGS